MRSSFASHAGRAALLFVVLTTACRSNEPAQAPETGSEPDVAFSDRTDTTEPRRNDAPAKSKGSTAEAIRALEAGDLDKAKRAIDALLTERAFTRATTALAAGKPADALVSIDALVEARHPDAARLKAEGSLALAESTIAAGGNGLLIQGALADALAFFEQVTPATVETHLGASRAAWLLSDTSAAADHARAALTLLEEHETADDAALELALRRSAEASFGAYRSLKSASAPGESSDVLRARFDETETALSSLLGIRGDDPWVWETLADLYEWEGMSADARAIAERGLERAPERAGLWERLGRVARNANGRPEAAQALDAASAEAPAAPLGHWYRAWERFELALDGYHAGEDAREDFRAAETAFARFVELEPSLAESARGYQVMCRAGVGWCAFAVDELDAAASAFRSMNDVFAGGVAWDIEGRLGSGLLGLEFVGSKLNEQKRWAEAGATYRELFELSASSETGKDPTFANNAGFFLRDAAVEEEFLAQRLCSLARGEEAAVSSRERVLGMAQLPLDSDEAALRKSAAEHLERAIEWMRESGEIYLEAARLLPDDVRVVNDAALVHIYYLYTELPWSEEQLLRLVELGERQLADESLGEDARWELENAWGDVHQNLGVLWATLKDAPAQALPWFERAAEIGPEPRPEITNQWIPFCRGELEPDANFAARALATWGAPCAD